MKWDTVIGLEVHAQLKTKSKLFSGASTTFGATANTQASFIDAGLPGVLPVLNQQAVMMAIQFGLAINAKISENSFFERKNYFYPDLPKGYQISQYQCPIVAHGYLLIETKEGIEKKITINRAHLEEDAGKSIHDAFSDHTGIDLNRAGNPLLEIVTDPCLSSSEEAICYLKNLHQLLVFLGICDGNMQEGSFRCDVNISLKSPNTKELGTRTEIKNLNSFRFIEKAIEFERERHATLLENGESIQQETRLFCPDTGRTRVMRVKENENDYRYFPDPDLLPIHISVHEIELIKNSLVPLPKEIKLSLQKNSELSEEDINFLLTSPSIFQFFQSVKEKAPVEDKLIINWLRGPYLARLNETHLNFENPPLSAEKLAQLLNRMVQHSISFNVSKQLFYKLWDGAEDIDSLLDEAEKDSIGSESLETLIQHIVSQFPNQVLDYQSGKDKIFGFFVGQVMKETKGKANPKEINELLKKHLSKIQ